MIDRLSMQMFIEAVRRIVNAANYDDYLYQSDVETVRNMLPLIESQVYFGGDSFTW